MSWTEDLMDALTEYTDEVMNDTKEIFEDEAKKLSKKIKADSPRSDKVGRHYANGWRVANTTESSLTPEYTVYNKLKPQLTHLLQGGHANRDGSRTEGIEHIDKNEDEAVERTVKRIEGVI
ncbi:MAG: hypothetical protein GX957_03645 [Clostridiaceae bacterium]|nr:hypothetical protein [Clostridiaceae bacterium]